MAAAIPAVFKDSWLLELYNLFLRLRAFAAVKSHGVVVSLGEGSYGGHSWAIRGHLHDVAHVVGQHGGGCLRRPKEGPHSGYVGQYI